MSETHEHPTPLLLPYVREELERDEMDRIREHLEDCLPCAEEEQAVRLLNEGEVEGLSDLERARLHHAVVASTSEVSTAHGGPLLRRLAPYMGVAAVLAMLAVGVMIAEPGTSPVGEPGLETDSEADREGSSAERFQGGAGRDVVQDEGGGTATEANALGTAGPSPFFEPAAGRLAAADLHRLGSSTEPFVGFSRTYRAEAAPSVQEQALAQLTADLSADESATVEECARSVLRSSSHDPVPVYGGYGSLDGQEVLLLGFTWSAARSGPLDQFMVWAWPRGSCDSPLVYRFGQIRR